MTSPPSVTASRLVTMAFLVLPSTITSTGPVTDEPGLMTLTISVRTVPPTAFPALRSVIPMLTSFPFVETNVPHCATPAGPAFVRYTFR